LITKDNIEKRVLTIKLVFTGAQLPGSEWGVTPPRFWNSVTQVLLAFENFFLNTKSKKSAFLSLFNYSIYLKEDITTPGFLKI